MSKDTKPMTLDKDVEERLIELQKENCDGVDHFHFHIHYSVMEQFLATEIKAAEQRVAKRFRIANGGKERWHCHKVEDLAEEYLNPPIKETKKD